MRIVHKINVTQKYPILIIVNNCILLTIFFVICKKAKLVNFTKMNNLLYYEDYSTRYMYKVLVSRLLVALKLHE